MSKKKIIRLRESEMIDLIEKIVKEVKTQKRKTIRENVNRKKPTRKPVRRNTSKRIVKESTTKTRKFI